MNFILFFTIILFVSGAFDLRKARSALAQNINILATSTFGQCEGKYSANYTRIQLASTSGDCQTNLISPPNSELVQCNSNGEKAVNELQSLGLSNSPDGANNLFQSLDLVTSGPLQGRYVYYRIVNTNLNYLKKCSSVLGMSNVSSRNAQLLISDNLNLNVLISPMGAFEAFKKGCNTICKGEETIF